MQKYLKPHLEIVKEGVSVDNILIDGQRIRCRRVFVNFNLEAATPNEVCEFHTEISAYFEDINIRLSSELDCLCLKIGDGYLPIHNGFSHDLDDSSLLHFSFVATKIKVS